MPVVVNVTVVVSAQGAEKVAVAGPPVCVHRITSGSLSGSVAWPNRVRSLAGNAIVLAGPASTTGGFPLAGRAGLTRIVTRLVVAMIPRKTKPETWPIRSPLNIETSELSSRHHAGGVYMKFLRTTSEGPAPDILFIVVHDF